MKRWISFIARLYPRNWRAEFGAEFDALLDDMRPGWRVFANVLGGAIRMQITTGMNWLKLVSAMVVVGAIVGLGVSFTVAPVYTSSAVISVTPQVDPVRPESPEAVRARAAARAEEIIPAILSHSGLSAIIQDTALDLYNAERKRIPVYDVSGEMRRNIRILARPSTAGRLVPIVLDISFAYPDPVNAQAAVRGLAKTFLDLNANDKHFRDDVYLNFWKSEWASGRATAAPPPPPGEIVKVVLPASLPTEHAGPNRLVFTESGLGAGLVLGLLGTLAMRWPSGAWRMGRFALAGCALACAVSFLISERYTSSGLMMLASARLTEDPLAPIPSVTPVAVFLEEVEPQVLSVERLSEVIARLDLYPTERASKPIEEIVRNMVARDIRIVGLKPAEGTTSAFTISFSYSDRDKAQQAVWGLMNAIDSAYWSMQMSKASQVGSIRRGIIQRKACEFLDVIDTASLPVSPDGLSRLEIVGVGLGMGLLLGAISLCLPRPPAYFWRRLRVKREAEISVKRQINRCALGMDKLKHVLLLPFPQAWGERGYRRYY